MLWVSVVARGEEEVEKGEGGGLNRHEIGHLVLSSGNSELGAPQPI